MISKKRIVAIVAISTVVSGTLGFLGGNLASFTLGNRTVIRSSQYGELVDIYEKYGKLDILEEYIDTKYLRDVDDEALVDGAIRGMFEALEDPYSAYMSVDEFEKFNEANSGKFTGVGIVVSQNKEGFIEIVSPIEGTPGERADLRAGDRIIKVDGVEYSGKQLNLAVSNIKGEKGTYVDLTILREDKSGEVETIEKSIIRDEIETESVKAEIIDGDIGYLRLSAFRQDSFEDFKEGLNELRAGGAKSLVLDLRGNGGGSFRVATEIAEELIGPGTIVYTEDKSGRRDYVESKTAGIDIPLVVLVDKGSASASEILAGAIKDNEEGTIVGTTTYGKGLVQIVQDLPDGSGFKLTISEYFSPNGNSIDQKGIEPDVAVELPKETRSMGPDSLNEDTQLQKAIEILRR